MSNDFPRKEALAAGLLLVLPGLLWAWLDHRPWPWDQAHYAEITLRTLAAFGEGPVAGVASMGVLMSLKPPGPTWLGTPFALLADLFGRIEPALLCATLAWQAGTLIACYASASLITGSRLAAIASTAFIGSTPMFIGMNHQYLAEPLQTFSVALAFLLALLARDLSRPALFFALCIVASLAMVAKSTSLLYCGLPLAWAASMLLRRSARPPAAWVRRGRVPLLLLSLSCVALAINWYVGHFSEMFEHARQSTVGDVVQNYGARLGFGAKLAYWISAFAAALVFPSWLVALAAVAGAALPRREAATGPDATTPAFQPSLAARLVVAAAAIHLAAGLAAYSLQVNDDARFLEPLLPASAIVLAWLCGRLPRIAPRALLAAAAVQFILGYGYALGWSSNGSAHPWLLGVERDPTRRAQLQALVDLTCDPARPHDVNLVGVQYGWLSATSANFYAVWAQAGQPVCRYASLDNGTMTAPVVLRRLQKFVHRYYVSVTPARMESPPDFLNRAAAESLARVASSTDWEHVKTIDGTIVVFRSKHFPGVSN